MSYLPWYILSKTGHLVSQLWFRYHCIGSQEAIIFPEWNYTLGVLFLTLQVGPELFDTVLHVSKYGVVDILVVGFPRLSLYCCF